jgi:methylenetetrahydrofolate dehydrogenase (NADP+)/methenyltetrahydrofolate cyclohydrolase
MAQIIDGKELSLKLREQIKEEVLTFTKESGITPGLAVVLVGNDPASALYVKNKIKGCAETGIKSFSYHLPENVSEKELVNLINTLNADVNVHGLLVQVPLPPHINERKVLEIIDYKKDVDGFHAMNLGNLLLNRETLYSCTPLGCIKLIKSKNIDISGKNAVVVGRSNNVGKPLALMLLQENATVTVCHSKTVNLKEICRTADILCVAVGKANFIKGDMVKEGAVVIDVGMNRQPDGKFCGDVDFAEVEKVASFITPVPGGVGPMTITMLLHNTLKAAKAQCRK